MTGVAPKGEDTIVNRGVDILIEVEESEGKFIPVGFQRGGTLNRDAETIDITNKSDFGWANSEVGVLSWSIDCDGILVETDKALSMLEEAFLARRAVRSRIKYPSGTVYVGKSIITSFPVEVPYDDVATYSMTLTGKGKLEKSKDETK